MNQEREYSMKTTLKDIKAFDATDITNAEPEQLFNLRKHGLKRIAYSVGTYGITGAVYWDMTTGLLYKVTARSTALFALGC